jgi:predicted small lipoprotein YifL
MRKSLSVTAALLLSTTIAACGPTKPEPATDEAAATEQPEATMDGSSEEATPAAENAGAVAASGEEDEDVDQDRGNPIDD